MYRVRWPCGREAFERGNFKVEQLYLGQVGSWVRGFNSAIGRVSSRQQPRATTCGASSSKDGGDVLGLEQKVGLQEAVSG